MAGDSDLEKTEPASPRRLEQAREDGDVPRSRELATFALLVAAVIGIKFSGAHLVSALGHMLDESLSFNRTQAYDPDLLFLHIAAQLVDVLIALAPLLGILFLFALLAPLLLGGWLFSAKAVQPKLSRLNPVSGIGNMFSSRSVVELVKAIAKALLLGTAAWLVLDLQISQMLALAVEPPVSAFAQLGNLLFGSFAVLVGVLAIVALVDVPYQMWQYATRLKMTREELRREAKEADGDPQIKARIRQLQRELARRRMMAEVPKADVVITNPEHYAVALRYTEGGMTAPVVLAKGVDEVASRIRSIAQDSRVPLVEAPPLARALYRHAGLGDEIPAALYAAVAEVLAYVFQLRASGSVVASPPQPPTGIVVPAGMDPLDGSGSPPEPASGRYRS